LPLSRPINSYLLIVERGTIPWTDTNHNDFEVSFPSTGNHIFIRTDVYGIHRSLVANPKYKFGDEDECNGFQSYVRERDLIGTYEAASITVVRGHREEIMASGQYVKIWQAKDDTKHPSFTFWVSEKTELDHEEYDCADFVLSSKQPRDQAIVRLQANGTASKGNIDIDTIIIKLEFDDGMLARLEFRPS